MRTPLRAVLFDFDGVLVDSEPVHCRAYLETAAAMGVPLTEQQYYRELIGFDDRGAVAHVFRAAGRALDESTYHRFLEQKTARVIQLIDAGYVRALRGAGEFVRGLHGRCAMGICSGALRHEIDAMLRGIGLRELFDAITAAEGVTVGKPDPSGYLLTARRLSEKIGRELTPGECLVVEDAPNVAVRAAAAGFRVLGVTTTFDRDAWPTEIRTVSSLDPREVGAAVPGLSEE